MAGEQAEAMPEELRSWLERKAAEQDENPRDLLIRAVVAYRFLEGESETLERAVEERLADVDDRMERVAGRLDTVEDETDTRVAELGERLVQVTQELESVAPANHAHDDLEDRVEDVASEAAANAERLDALDDRLSGGFSNFEEVLEYLTDTTADVEEKLTRVASVLRDVRDRTRDLEAAAARRDAVDELRREAHADGSTSGRCSDCGGTVHLGLLTEPVCPHCGATFVDFEPGPRFFGSATLSVGDRPALEAASEPPADPLEDSHE